jgi:hypothetical protein
LPSTDSQSDLVASFQSFVVTTVHVVQFMVTAVGRAALCHILQPLIPSYSDVVKLCLCIALALCLRRQRISFVFLFLLVYMALPVHAMDGCPGVGNGLQQQILSVLSGAGEEVPKTIGEIMSMLGSAFPGTATETGQPSIKWQLGKLVESGCIRKNKPTGRKYIFVQNQAELGNGACTALRKGAVQHSPPRVDRPCDHDCDSVAAGKKPRSQPGAKSTAAIAGRQFQREAQELTREVASLKGQLQELRSTSSQWFALTCNVSGLLSPMHIYFYRPALTLHPRTLCTLRFVSEQSSADGERQVKR